MEYAQGLIYYSCKSGLNQKAHLCNYAGARERNEFGKFPKCMRFFKVYFLPFRNYSDLLSLFIFYCIEYKYTS